MVQEKRKIFLGTVFLLPKAPPVKDASLEKGLFVSRATWLRYFRHPQTGLLLVQFFFFSFIFAAFTSGFALFTERRYQWAGVPFSAREVGFVLAGLGLYGIILQGGLVGRLAKAIGERKMVSLGFITCLVGYFLLGFAFDLKFMAVALLISSFGTGILRPGLTSLLSQYVDRSEQGLVMGLAQSLGSVAQIVAPIFSGLLIQANYLKSWSFLMAAVSLIAVVLFQKWKVQT